MDTKTTIEKAREHIGKGHMIESAILCFSDALDLYAGGNYDQAKVRAKKSIAYSVGYFHPDYKAASN